ncbi:MAG: S8 family serine peptidase [Candidatus Yanofskybacteria bacterium]|nr:S8 family serine peptidase [Candidatus Yanofskybacteria bacterium]
MKTRIKKLFCSVCFLIYFVSFVSFSFAQQKEISLHKMNTEALIASKSLKGKEDKFLSGRIVYKRNDSPSVYPLSFDKRIQVEDMLQYVQGLPDVEYAQPDFVYKAVGTDIVEQGQPSAGQALSDIAPPNDPYYPIQVHLRFIGMDTVYKRYGFELGRDETRGEDIHIHIVDSGGGCDHPDVDSGNIIPEKDYIDFDDNPCSSPYGMGLHGTFMLGIIAAKTNNGHGGAGIVPRAKFHIWRVLGKNGSGSTFAIAAAIGEIVNRSEGLGNEIVNLALGTKVEDPLIKYYVEYGSSVKKITFVAASGNDGTNRVIFPAAFPEVIAVGATTFPDARAREKKRAPYSNYGPETEIMVPVGDLDEDLDKNNRSDGIVVEGWINEINDLTGIPYYKMYIMTGTSPATAVVSGLAGLLMTAGIRDPEEIRKILAKTADDVPPGGRDDETGWGMVRAYTSFASIDNRLPVFGFFSQETFACSIVVDQQSCEVTVGYTVEPRGWQVYLYDNFNGGTLRELTNYQGEEKITVNAGNATGVLLIYYPEGDIPVVFAETTVYARTPAANFSANSSVDITVKAGDQITYKWSSVEGTFYRFDLAVLGPSGQTCDPLGNCSGQVPYFSPGSGGSLGPAIIDPRQAGYTYTFYYTVTSPGGSARSFATIRVKTATP